MPHFFFPTPVPFTAYHASKLFGEHLVRIANRKKPTGATLRLTSPVGPGMPENRILSVFAKQALTGRPIQLAGQGSRRQDYVDVRDIAYAVELCLKGRVKGLYNIAGGTSISNRELAETCVRVLNSSSPIEFSGAPDPEEGIIWDVSIAKASRQFGYEPQHGIEQSISACVAASTKDVISQ
ncbi:NAD-dependent epimerase/dehydratase family protein [Verrucomicrobiota bacterium]